MDLLPAEYSDYVKRAWGKVYMEYAFTLATTGLSLAVGPFTAVAGFGTIVTLFHLLTLDGTAAVEPGAALPAAMFHDQE